jgi:hypothetical protein
MIPDIYDIVVRSAEQSLGRAHRFRSWQHCYTAFQSELDEEYHALHLGFYLASWGMYRGSTFLLQKDYTIHVPIVRLLKEAKYSRLKGARPDILKAEIELIAELCERIRDTYSEELKLSLASDLSDHPIATKTLISKVLLGTMGCVPAFDRFLLEGAAVANCKLGNLNKTNILKCLKFYCDNEAAFAKVEGELGDRGFPPMKLLDMYFWEVGFQKAEGKFQ